MINKFEEQYTILKLSVFGKAGYNQEIVSKALEESKNTLLLILKERNIDYDEYFSKELIDIYERRNGGNPNNLPFSEKFQSEIYSDYFEKLSYLDFLFEECPPTKHMDIYLLNVAKITLCDDPLMDFSSLFYTFDMLYLKEVQRINIPFLFEVIDVLIDKVDRDTFTTDVFVRVDSLIQDYYEPKYYPIIEKGKHHPYDRVKEYFRFPLSNR